MQVHIVTKIARQIEGEMCFINVIKAFKNKDNAKYWIMSNRIPAHETIEGIDCIVEIGLLEDVEVED